ncbi:13484_t:CDS:2, partial [Racocetra persica]
GWFRAGIDTTYYFMGVDSAIFYGNLSGLSGFVKFDTSYENKLNPNSYGTGDWTKCESVLDVTRDAVNLVFGVFLLGTGQVWFNQFEFNVVSSNDQTTGLYIENVTSPPDTTGSLYYPVSFSAHHLYLPLVTLQT